MKLRIALVGCGAISKEYGKDILRHPESLELVGAFDLDRDRAAAFCAEYGGQPFSSLDAVLADPGVDVVLNLTVHRVHFEINKQALSAGKHVYSEKPMALTYGQARELCELSARTGRRLASAPATFLGEGIQTACRILNEGRIGQLRLVYAEVNWGQIDRWVPAPASYFSVGPLLDVGVYAITALTFLLGPVRSVWGYSTILKDQRVGVDGVEFPVTAPDFTTGMLEFASGVVARITTNYYVNIRSQEHLRGLEFHGDDGSLSVSDYHDFNPQCRFIPYDQEAIPVPLLREPKYPMDRAIGLVDLSYALRDGSPHRTSAEQAAHVIEVMEGLRLSATEHRTVEIRSSFDRPPLVDWAQTAATA